MQVSNGLAGAIIIQGKFDDDLRALFGGTLKEHLLVLQLIHDLNFTTSNSVATQPLINGQPSPVIDMYPGEIRRLRFVAATVQADGAVTIDFNSTPALHDRAVSPATVGRGRAVTLSGVITEPDPGDAFELDIDWGDGTPPQVVTVPPDELERVGAHAGDLVDVEIRPVDVRPRLTPALRAALEVELTNGRDALEYLGR